MRLLGYAAGFAGIICGAIMAVLLLLDPMRLRRYFENKGWWMSWFPASNSSFGRIQLRAYGLVFLVVVVWLLVAMVDRLLDGS